MDFGRSKKKVSPRGVTTANVTRLRIRWGRNHESTRFSHLDNISTIETAIKRSGLPVTYTQSANPRMKLSFSPPLPVGFTSEAEFVDITLEKSASNDAINKFRSQLASGYDMLEAKTILAKTGSLSEQLNRVEYTLELDDKTDMEQLKNTIKKVMDKKSIVVLRKTKSGESEVDIRPAIYELTIDENTLHLRLGIGDGGYARPTEVAQILFGYDEEQAGKLKYHRARLYRLTEEGNEIPAIEL